MPWRRRADITAGLHFLHRQLILWSQVAAKPYRIRGTIEGIGRVRYLFGEFSFDADRRELHRGTDLIAIAPQVFDLLLDF